MTTGQRLDPRALSGDPDNDGHVLTTQDGVPGWAAPSSGTVDTIVPGNNIIVDSTDPANPIVSAAELLMQDGVTSPPVPIETEAGDDWLYEG